VPESEDVASLAFYKYVGERVRSARIGAGISQAVLAGQVGLTRSSVANLEAARQRTPLHHFVLICRALNADVNDFIPHDPEYHKSLISPKVQIELANSPETAKEFVRGAVARLQSSNDSTDGES
jgi:transcriptional regulator with XRE-family HTH domain